MSGRSAYVRKKATDTKSGKQVSGSRGRARSVTSSDNATISDYPIGPLPSPRHVQALRREKELLEGDMLNYHNGTAPHYIVQESVGSQSGPGWDGSRERPDTAHIHALLNDPAYDRSRRQTIKTEDVSGIEKSGLRSALDKRSDGVRKGLAKAFAFKKKGNRDEDAWAVDFRPESSATVRPAQIAGARPHAQGDGYEATVPPGEYRRGPLNPGLQRDEVGDSLLPSPSALSFTAPEAVIPPIKRWVGAGRPVQRWNKLKKDPELWDPNGDVLVFLDDKGQSPPSRPSFRVSSHIVEATGSRFLITRLREGSTEADMHVLMSPAGAPPMLQRSGPYGQQHLAPGGFARGGQITPPGVEENVGWDMDGQISYEMYFPAPANMTMHDQLRYNITTRNVFALLYHASLVGLGLHQTLVDLHSRLDSYMTPGADNAGTILNYLAARGSEDVRNDPETAVSLLAWSEGREVRWEDGWRESFLHCAGMYSQLEACADFKHVTPITRALLERANLETQLRVHAAEERLATFEYGDMWPAALAITASSSGPVGAAPAKAAMDRLQQFLVQYYSREFGSWPPPEDTASGTSGTVGGGEDIWLTRTVTQLLQRDFAALYDYLVNRDVVWDESEARSSRKWMMVSESGNKGFEADTPDLPMTDMFIEFDNKHRFPHVPYPYPLVPDSIPPLPATSNATKESSSSGIFGRKTAAANPAAAALTVTQAGNGNGRAGSVERRIQLAYTEATNICILGSDFTHSNLIDAFSKFEKSDQVGEVDPSTGRRGRWVLVYGILQTLASISVDAPNLRYGDDVAYHVSPRLKGVKMPPWKASSNNNPRPTHDEAAHELSHCWTVLATWHAGSNSASGMSASGTEDSADGSASAGVSPISPYPAPHTFPPLPRPPHRHRHHNHHHQQRAYYGSVRSASSSRAPSLIGGYGNTAFSGAASTATSVLSYSGSDTTAASSIRPMSSVSRHQYHQHHQHHPQQQQQQQPQGRRRTREASSTRRAVKGAVVVEEQEWTAGGGGGAGTRRGYGGGGGAPVMGFPFHVNAAARGKGGYQGAFSELDDLLDEEVDVDGATFILPLRRAEGYHGVGRGRAAPAAPAATATVVSGEGGGSGGVRLDGDGDGDGGREDVFDRPLLDRGGSDSEAEAEEVGPVPVIPVIRDFDELGAMD